MNDDHRTIGRVLRRRELLAMMAATGVGLLAGSRVLAESAARVCVARPRQTAGPFYLDDALERADLRSDRDGGDAMPGLPLGLTVALSRLVAGRCEALPGARVDLWHCDADGRYSGVRDARADTRGQDFLRGWQRSDAAGEVRFFTIYPGWYGGRAVHLHFSVRLATADGRQQEFTSQLYFDDALTDRIHAEPPYDARAGRRRRNAADPIFRRGGDELLLSPLPAGDGLEARFELALA
jgi:protocatechuate 3,4-dioxygenase beta subunit